MKRRIWGLLVVLTLLLALPFGAAAEDSGTDVTITVDPSSGATLTYGSNITFTVTGNDAAHTPVTGGNIVIFKSTGGEDWECIDNCDVTDGKATFPFDELYTRLNPAFDAETRFRYMYSGYWDITEEGDYCIWRGSDFIDASFTLTNNKINSVILTSTGYAYGAPTSGFSVASADAHVTPKDISIYEPETGNKDAAFGEKAYEVHLQLTTATGYSLAPDAVVTLDGKTGKYVGDGYYVFQLDELCPIYSIKYNTDGGTLSNAPTQYDKNSGEITIPRPTKEGCRFTGWTGTGLTDKTPDVVIPAKSTGDREYTANWEKIVYHNIDFVTKHGTAPAEQRVESGTKATKPDDPTENGWKFKGWYRSDDYIGEAFDFAAPITEDITLYAKWVKTWTVTFNVGGHGTAPAAQTVEDGAKAAKPAALSEKGYRFDGWYTDAKCTKAYKFDTPVTEDITLYAKWTRLYTLTFETNGGTKIDSIEAPEGSLVYLSTYKPTKKGYSFSGWYTDKNLTQGNRVTSVTMNGNKTLYAKWSVTDKTNPPTADTAMPGLALAILSFSGMGLTALGIRKRK